MCANAQRLAENSLVEQAVAAFVLSLVLTPGAGQIEADLKRTYSHVHRALLPHLLPPFQEPANVRCVLTHAIYRYLEERGAQYRWQFEDVSKMASLLLPAVVAVAADEPLGQSAGGMLAGFCQEYGRLCQRQGPFHGCSEVCGERCLYRYAVAPFAEREVLQDAFRNAIIKDDMESLSGLCEYVVDQILSSTTPGPVRRQAALCFVVHQVDAWRDYGWIQQRSLVERLTAYDRIVRD
jgi:hypothetical protein